MTTSFTPGELDDDRVGAFAERLFGLYTDGLLTLMIDVGQRTGLFSALAAGPGTSAELAARAGLEERYVRECLGALTTAGIVDYAADGGVYTLPAEHAVCLTGGGSTDLAPMSAVVTLLARQVGPLAQVFRDGGGIPYEAYRPEFTTVMDGMSRGLFDDQLITGIVEPAGLAPTLTAGVAVADIGCGTGHSTNLLARTYPRSTFVGYDLAGDALDHGRAEADGWGLDNVTFEPLDLVDLPSDPPLDVVVAFDVVHDQADPATVLRRVHDALGPGGVFVMMDTKASSRLEDNVGNPFAPLLYAVSTLHCLTVSLARDGAGLGTVWGEQTARRMLADAGFTDVTVRDVPDDPLDSVYVARTASARAMASR
ncbi:class I SAM-dependent methyltransferase [Jiangella mangrovi]|uniref:SAM-dependent methyltransferase n=1 Tax=Jiangella mangrovi TaxID=1524084 RepID=A0A7W9GSW9_9ACTN|nr:class I SAM-dependent methyltransferase [Jiangella mangrovi]MBB5789111.1 SAM-dependent methyltransferase [Jiangella mangrovi]